MLFVDNECNYSLSIVVYWTFELKSTPKSQALDNLLVGFPSAIGTEHTSLSNLDLLLFPLANVLFYVSGLDVSF